jgi:uncharacterized BrkB/YihY/UPF0761 family membrane protein
MHNKDQATAAQIKEDNKMDYKKLTTIIPILSVCVMLVWGLIANDWSKCWIAVVIGGVLTAICRAMAGNDKKE